MEKTLTKRLLICIALALLLSRAAQASDDSWIVGDWLLAYDPDGNRPDRLTFSESGQFVTTEVASGSQARGIYFVKPGVVSVFLFYEGEVLMKLKFTYDEKRNKLYYHPAHARGASYYTKIEQ